jgi:hypothetical protein
MIPSGCDCEEEPLSAEGVNLQPAFAIVARPNFRDFSPAILACNEHTEIHQALIVTLGKAVRILASVSLRKPFSLFRTNIISGSGTERPTPFS